MSKGLEALKTIVENTFPYTSTLYDLDMLSQDREIIRKELKALEIIKDKNVNIHNLILARNLDIYNSTIGILNLKLTQEKFDLLKEVLE